MVISKETLEAVNRGVISDIQLKEALAHYSLLEKLLYPHGEIYQLVWVNVVGKLETLRNMLYVRNGSRKLNFDREGNDL